MVDLSSLTAMMTAAGSVIGLANKANSVEANQKIIELQSSMAEVQRGIAELFQENQELKQKNRELQEELDGETLYPLRHGVRWKKAAGGDRDDGPNCPTCFGKAQKLLPLVFLYRENGGPILKFVCHEKHEPPGGNGRYTGYSIPEEDLRPGRYRLDK
jgi:hypothetical protein